MPRVKFDKSDLPNGRETTRDEFLAKFLTDETLTDFQLEGTDGIRVPANRWILSARSDVFHKMLLGDFSEATKEVVKVGFTGRVIKTVVEYILCDGSKELAPRDDEDIVTIEDVRSIQFLVDLTGAALYFNLSRLCVCAFESLSDNLEIKPSLSFAALEAYRRNPASVSSVEALIMSFISSTKIGSVNKDIVASLSPAVLEEIIKDKEIQVDEYQLFEILRLWANIDAEGAKDDDDDDRGTIASNLVKHIHLEWIDPKILSTSVAESMMNVLKYPPMKSGVHKWVLEVMLQWPEDQFHCWLGVILARGGDSFFSSNLYQHRERTWEVSANGGQISGGRLERSSTGLSYGQCSRVTFTLNLLPDGDGSGGTLSVAVNYQDSITIVSDMLKLLEEEGNADGFVPSVGLFHGEGVCLIEIMKLRN